MAEPIHAKTCPCEPCYAKRPITFHPREAFVRAMDGQRGLDRITVNSGSYAGIAGPLYPRGPDNTSDETDAEMDELREDLKSQRGAVEDWAKAYQNSEADLRIANAWNAALEKKAKEMEARIQLAAPHLAVHCDCESWSECGKEVSDLLMGVR